MKNLTKQRVFKIQHKETGLFSQGGSWGPEFGRFDKLGKVWQQFSHVISHLWLQTGSDIPKVDIVMYELVERSRVSVDYQSEEINPSEILPESLNMKQTLIAKIKAKIKNI